MSWSESFTRIVDTVMKGEVPELVDINMISEKGMMLLCEVIRSRRLSEELVLARKKSIVMDMTKRYGARKWVTKEPGREERKFGKSALGGGGIKVKVELEGKEVGEQYG